jgi:hypothetical protein
MAWTNISNANLDVGAPIRSIDILALRDNISAQANGDAGAPKQQTAGIQDGAITGAKLSGAQSGSAPVFGARAWVNFNGDNVPAIRSSGNVSSITDLNIGNYRINLTTAMSDTNYSVVFSRKIRFSIVNSPTSVESTSTTNFEIYMWEGGGGSDSDLICCSVFR